MFNDLSRENIEKNLIDIGCNHRQIQNFFKCYDNNDKQNMYYLLRKQRCYLLEDVHKEQKNRLFGLSCICFKKGGKRSMKKRVLVISTSKRINGNSDILANQFLQGAKDSGHETIKISLANKNIQFCKGCLVCQQKKPCVIQDDVAHIVDEIKKADVIAFATPIYFYEMSGQMKTILDRTNPLFIQDYNFRDIYLLATSADEDDKAMDVAMQGLQGWITCFDKASFKGIVRGLGIDQYDEINIHDQFLDMAYSLGTKV